MRFGGIGTRIARKESKHIDHYTNTTTAHAVTISGLASFANTKSLLLNKYPPRTIVDSHPYCPYITIQL